MALPVPIEILIERSPIVIPNELVSRFMMHSHGEGLIHIERNSYIDKVYGVLKSKEGEKVYFKQLMNQDFKDFSEKYFYLIDVEQTDRIIKVIINRKPERV
ncbi:MAG: hypothetical protein LLF83_04140 [Methanobacterium sp.]|nr:hypothetical protein [Methanobacterium sp.]